MNIQEYLTAGIENITKNAVNITLKNPLQSIFMTRFSAAVREASGKRAEVERCLLQGAKRN